MPALVVQPVVVSIAEEHDSDEAQALLTAIDTRIDAVEAAIPAEDICDFDEDAVPMNTPVVIGALNSFLDVLLAEGSITLEQKLEYQELEEVESDMVIPEGVLVDPDEDLEGDDVEEV